ncbi:hypothetical protein HI914_07157 [Erysiphe necator]|nr:hypothetical protein HI914_07157 [Erysiphe necator]
MHILIDIKVIVRYISRAQKLLHKEFTKINRCIAMYRGGIRAYKFCQRVHIKIRPGMKTHEGLILHDHEMTKMPLSPIKISPGINRNK